MKKRTVVDEKTGTRYTLVQPEENGLVPCDGEAHSNPYIDNCGRCAPRWGQMMSYKPVPLSALAEGKAVAVGDTAERPYLFPHREFEIAEKAGTIRMVQVTEKRRGCITSFFAYVRVTPG